MSPDGEYELVVGELIAVLGNPAVLFVLDALESARERGS
jgi:hypothetical protein